MSLTTESEKQNRMPFLDVNIICEDKTFTTSVYHKHTFNGVCAYYDSFLPSAHEFGTAYTFAYRCFQICSSWTKLHTELVCLKRIFLQKWLP